MPFVRLGHQLVDYLTQEGKVALSIFRKGTTMQYCIKNRTKVSQPFDY